MNKLLLLWTYLFLAIPCQARVITVDDDGPADFSNIHASVRLGASGRYHE
jgi:hypothetical protein